MQNQAHTAKIVDIIYAPVKGQHCFFTASHDKQLKAWAVSPDEKSFAL